jgi:hypothetical protein
LNLCDRTDSIPTRRTSCLYRPKDQSKTGV